MLRYHVTIRRRDHALTQIHRMIALGQPQNQHALTAQRISLLEWQGDLWIALRDMPRFAPPPTPGVRSLRTLLNRWWG